MFVAGVPMFRKYDARGTLLFERHIEGPEVDEYLRTMPTRWPTRRTEDGDLLPLVPPAVRTAGVDREGRLWIALTSPFTYVYDGVGRQGPHRAVQGREPADAEQPVLHQGRTDPRHAGLLRVQELSP